MTYKFASKGNVLTEENMKKKDKSAHLGRVLTYSRAVCAVC